MKRSFIIGAATAVALVSCSKNETINSDLMQDNNIIAFSTYAPITESVTKGTAVTNSNFAVTQDFRAVGFVDIANFDDAIVDAEFDFIGGKWTYADMGDAGYWPEDGTTSDFYAISPSDVAGVTFSKRVAAADGSTTVNSIVITDYTVPTDINAQTDLMYAAALNQSKPTVANTPVALAFEHALTQVEVYAATESHKLFVDVEANGVTFHNINSVGDFTVAGNVATAAGTPNDVPEDTDVPNSNSGVWSGWATPASYTASVAAVTINNPITNTDFAPLTSISTPALNPDGIVGNADDVAAVAGNVLMLLPQVLGTTTPGATGADIPSAGAYIEIKLRVYQLDDTPVGGGAAVRNYLYGDATTYESIYIPIGLADSDPLTANNQPSTWVQGTVVRYNVTFNTLGGVLEIIYFDPTVEDYVPVNSGVIGFDF